MSGGPPRRVILVEGLSDKLAVEALAARRGADLEAFGISVVSTGGSKNFPGFLEQHGPHGLNIALAGLTTPARNAMFDAASREPVSGGTLSAPTSNGWASSCATRTWRTS